MSRLKDRRIVLTGAAGGLGRAIAHKCCAEGARLLLVDLDAGALKAARESLADPAGADLLAIDITAPDAAAKIFHGDWQTPDALVNNAAIQGPVGPSWEVDWADWRKCIEIDLLAAVSLSHGCLPGMIRRGRGKIVNLSGGGATGPRARFTAYATAKSALVRFSESLAQELTGTGVDVNCIAPGAMPTAMLEGVFNLGAETAGQREYDAVLRARKDGQATIDKAAALCAYLVSSESDGISGKLISALWDPWSELQAHADDLKQTDIYTLRRIVPRDRGKEWGD